MYSVCDTSDQVQLSNIDNLILCIWITQFNYFGSIKIFLSLMRFRLIFKGITFEFFLHLCHRFVEFLSLHEPHEFSSRSTASSSSFLLLTISFNRFFNHMQTSHYYTHLVQLFNFVNLCKNTFP